MKKTLTWLLLFLLFTAAFSGAVLFLLPLVADRYVLPRLAASLPFSEKHLSIVRATPWSLQGVILLQHQEESGIAVPRFELRYSPRGLFGGSVDSLMIDSASLYLEKSGGSLAVRGMEVRTQQKEPGLEELQQPILPLEVEHIELKRCRIVYLAALDTRHYFGVEGSFSPEYEDVTQGGSRLASLRATFTVDGALAVSGSFETEPAAGGHRLSFDLAVENIGAAAPFFDLPAEMELAGKLNLQGELITSGLSMLSGYKATASFASFRFGFGGGSAAAAEKPIILSIEGTSANLHYHLENLEIDQPESLRVELEGEYNLESRRITGTANLLPGRIGKTITLSYEGGLGDAVDLDYRLSSKAFTLDSTMEVAAFSADGSLSASAGTIAAHIRGTIPSIKDASRHLELAGVTVELPFNMPKLAPGVVIPGNLIIDQIRYRDMHAGSLKGSVSIAADGLAFSSQLTSPLLEGLQLTCSGKSDYGRNAEIHCHQPAMRVASSDLNGLVALPENLDFETILAAESRFFIRDGVASGTAQYSHEGGRLSYDSYVFSDISGEMKFPALPALRSAPSQRLNIGKLQLGTISMADARIDLRLDDISTIFIEQAKIHWCGGRMEAAALRLQRGMETLATTLYCDRLGYTQLLDQLGIGKAQGEGSLNGRLPIRINRKGVKFDQGFLFSTPGKSGIVSFSNTEQFRQGIAAAERSIYLEYSLEALRNFSYDWTRLTFDTQGNELLLSLELDGKPTKPLLFGYENGRIVKKTEGDGIQHPIRLDVNFRLPVEELFRYGKGIQSLMENM